MTPTQERREPDVTPELLPDGRLDIARTSWGDYRSRPAPTVRSDADIALAAALSVAVPSMPAGDAMAKAHRMIDHLRAQGFDVLSSEGRGENQ